MSRPGTPNGSRARVLAPSRFRSLSATPPLPEIPLSSSLLRGLLPSPQRCFADAAGSTPCTDGSLIARWDDVRGASFGSFVQSTSGSRPVYRSSGDDVYADCTGGKWMRESGFTGLTTDNASAYAHLECVVRAAQFQTVFATGALNATPYWSAQYDSTSVMRANSSAGSVAPGATACALDVSGRYSWRCLPGGTTLRNEYAAVTGVALSSTTVDVGWLGTWGATGGGGGFPLTSKLRCLLVYGTGHAQSDEDVVWAWLARFGTPPTPPVNLPLVVCEGDSRTLGQRATLVANEYPRRMLTSLGGPSAVTVVNRGVGGSAVAGLSDRAAAIDAYLTGRTPSTSILVVWVGVNPTRYTLPALVSYCQARRAAGWRVVACVEPPSPSVTNAPTGTGPEWQAYRDGIRANSPVFADAIADLAADERLNADPANATYSDGLHYTDAGNAVVEEIVTPVVQAMLGG